MCLRAVTDTQAEPEGLGVRGSGGRWTLCRKGRAVGQGPAACERGARVVPRAWEAHCGALRGEAGASSSPRPTRGFLPTSPGLALPHPGTMEARQAGCGLGRGKGRWKVGGYGAAAQSERRCQEPHVPPNDKPPRHHPPMVTAVSPLALISEPPQPHLRDRQQARACTDLRGPCPSPWPPSAQGLDDLACGGARSASLAQGALTGPWRTRGPRCTCSVPLPQTLPCPLSICLSLPHLAWGPDFLLETRDDFPASEGPRTNGASPVLDSAFLGGVDGAGHPVFELPSQDAVCFVGEGRPAQAGPPSGVGGRQVQTALCPARSLPQAVCPLSRLPGPGRAPAWGHGALAEARGLPYLRTTRRSGGWGDPAGS